ncbi:MAG: zinc ribbon domain-containing protein [Pseudomonadota bacterium]
MPIYEYQCQDCGHQMELIHKMSDPPATDCPACGKPALKKKVSAAAFRLKGGGWYETDFKSGDKKKNLVENKGDKSKDSAGDSKSSGSGGAEKSDSASSGSKDSGSTSSTSKSTGDSSSSN